MLASGWTLRTGDRHSIQCFLLGGRGGLVLVFYGQDPTELTQSINERLAKLPGIRAEAVALSTPQQVMDHNMQNWDVKSRMRWSDYMELRVECQMHLQQGSAARKHNVFARLVAATLEDIMYVPQVDDAKPQFFEKYVVEKGLWAELHKDHLLGPISKILEGLSADNNSKLGKSLIDPVMHKLLEAPRLQPLDSDHSRFKLLFQDGMLFDFKTMTSRPAMPSDRMRLTMACPFEPWVPPAGAPDVVSKLCQWLPRKSATLEDDDLGAQIQADLEELATKHGCSLLAVLFDIFDCWHFPIHFLRNVAIMASADPKWNFINWLDGAGGAAKDTLLKICLKAFGEGELHLGMCEAGRKMTAAVDTRGSFRDLMKAGVGKRLMWLSEVPDRKLITELPKMLSEQTGASLSLPGKQKQVFRPMGLLWFTSNFAPTFKDGGFPRRLQLWGLPKSFTGTQGTHDDSLRERIDAGEFNGQLIYFALEMFKTLDKSLNPGLTLTPPPPSMADVIEEIHEEQFRGADSLQTFVNEKCVKVHRSEGTPVKDWRKAAAAYLGVEYAAIGPMLAPCNLKSESRGSPPGGRIISRMQDRPQIPLDAHFGF